MNLFKISFFPFVAAVHTEIPVEKERLISVELNSKFIIMIQSEKVF